MYGSLSPQERFLISLLCLPNKYKMVIFYCDSSNDITFLFLDQISSMYIV